MITRRDLIATLPALTLPALALPALALPAASAHSGPAWGGRAFPQGFTWGLAASAPQTESTAGRAASIWDVFSAQPGKIKDGSTVGRGTEWETRYPEDLDRVAHAGLRAFRFSIAWPRVQPAGQGAVNQPGLDLYDRMVDAMLARNIEPWPTLFHWDLPASLPGAWLNRDTALRFADYCGLMGRRLGDRVNRFIVLNEPGVVAVMGHALGQHAPGLASRPAFLAAMHHQNLAQGLGFAALRAVLRPGHKIGTTLSLQPCVPADGSASSAEAARAFDDAWNRGFLNPLFGKAYPRRYADELHRLLRPGDMDIIAAHPDFLGVNYYSRMHMRAAPGSVLGATWGAAPPGTPSTGLGWPIEPDGLVDQLRDLRDHYGNPEMFVTENGTTFPDPPPSRGVIADPQRIDFLRAHLQAARAAIAEGCNLRGYFGWTLTDNWEWAEGYSPAFGVVQVDRQNMRRTPKGSLFFLGRCAQSNTVI